MGMYNGTYLKAADNSGAKLLKCICIYKSKNPNVGSKVNLVLLKSKQKKKLVKKKKYFGYITSMAKPERRADGSVIKFSKNKIVMFDKDKFEKFLGTRVKGILSKSFNQKHYRFQKVMLTSKFI